MANSSLIPLHFNDQAIRVSDQDGNPWFVATDVCQALNIRNASDAVGRLDDDEKGVASTDTLGGKQDLIVVSEAGVYTLALRCRDAMKPGTAPYQFRKWVTGVALPALRKGHEPSTVTELSPDVRNAIGGIMKGVVSKALLDTLPALVAAEVASQQYTVSRGLTAGEVIAEAGIKSTKGLRGIARRVSDRLRRYHAEKGVPVKLGSLGTSTAYVFDLPLVREWLMAGGKSAIEQWISERRGQGRLKLVQ